MELEVPHVLTLRRLKKYVADKVETVAERTELL
jgi:hypothetical protein